VRRGASSPILLRRLAAGTGAPATCRFVNYTSADPLAVAACLRENGRP